MGSGIAQVAAQSGHAVLLFDEADGTVAKALENIKTSLEKLVSRGKFTPEQAARTLENLTSAESLQDFSCCGLVIEAVVEKLDVKQSLLKKIEDITDGDCIFASNTSSLSITALAAKAKRPHNVAGLHFFNPAPVMKLVEVISGLATDDNVVATLMVTATAWGKKPVRAKSTPGFIVNRVARPFYGESLRLLEEGASNAATIDAVMRESGGFRMGPFELMDLIGLDVNYAVTCSIYDACYQDPRYKPSFIQQEMVNGNFLGRKTGKGFYHYGDRAGKPLIQTAALSSSIVPAMKYEQFNCSSRVIQLDDTVIAMSDGRTATQRANEEGIANLVLVDLTGDFQTATRIAVCKADQTRQQHLDKAIAWLQSQNKQVSVIDDVAGMILLRTVCMLANEAADAVNQGVCSAADCDTAMFFGVNYPCGPLQWADDIGLEYVIKVLQNLSHHYGDGRYRISPLLKRKFFAGETFH